MNKPVTTAVGRWQVIPATLLLAFLLNLIPAPDWAQFVRPDWVTLVLFYWCLATPKRVGIGCGWLMGLGLDLLQYTLFGQQALGKALIALVAVAAYRRLRLYHLWQQCGVVLAVSAMDIAVVVWIHHLAHDVEFRLEYWQAALTTALLWPPVYLMLRKLRQHSGIVRR